MPNIRYVRRRDQPIPSGSDAAWNTRPNRWWLPAGATINHAIGIYSAKEAPDYSSSLVNLAHPGAFTLNDHTYVYTNPGFALRQTTPGWNASDGWVFANDPSSNATPAMALATGITSAQIGRGTGTIVVFFTGLQVPPDTNVNTLVCGDYNLTAASDRHTITELSVYKLPGGSALMVCQHGHIVLPPSDTDYSHHPAYASAGMLAIAGQHGYFNGAYTTFTGMPTPPWPNDRDTRDTYIGSLATFAETATFPTPDPANLANCLYSLNGVRANIQHVLFYDIALSQAQLDEVRDNAPV